MYYFFRWGERIVPRLPPWLRRLLPTLLSPLAWLLATGPRKQAMCNASHILGVEMLHTATGRRRLRRVVRGMFRNTISNYLDTFLVPSIHWSSNNLHQPPLFHEEHLKEALSLGKGVIAFSAHFGPFTYLASWLVSLGYQVTIPVENLQDERVMRLMCDLRSRSGVNYIPLGGSSSMRAIFQALRKNQIVLITADRAVQGESVVCDFFGAPARLPIGLVNLSIRTGAPLVGAVGWYSFKARVHAEIMRLSLALPEEDRQRPEVLHAALLAELEQIIGAHPEQWIVLSKVWEDEV